MLAAVLGDIFSYAQTRLFVRQVDSYQRQVVSVAFVIADTAISLLIFLIMFSFARFIAYVIALTTLNQPAMTYTTIYAQEGISNAIATITVDDADHPWNKNLRLLSIASTSGQLARVVSSMTDLDQSSLKDARGRTLVEYKVEGYVLLAFREK